MLEHSVMAQMRAAHPDWIWNRSDTHAFVAVPGTHESFKTPVEPGNSFSPGVRTYGVSSWVYVNGELHAPEEKSLDELKWHWQDGTLPLMISQWSAGPLNVTSRIFADGEVALSNIQNYLGVEVENFSDQTLEARFYLVIRSFGAAGGPLRSLKYEDGKVLVNGMPQIYPAQSPQRFGALSYEATKQDISVRLRRGEMPADTAVEDASTWVSGALEYSIQLEAGQKQNFDFVFHVQYGHGNLTWLKPLEATPDYETAESHFLEVWRTAMPKLQTPDKRFSEAFGATVAQMLTYVVGDAPRISPVTYPLWWMRDCAYVVVSFDRAGFHDVARRACLEAIRTDPMTGFGGEADVPGEVIWMLTEHFLLTRDRDFLAEAWPFIQRKAELLIKARHTEIPLKVHYEFVTHEHALRPDLDIFCAPAKDGLIQGRMDHHYPLYWVNAFAYIGLKRAAMCAQELSNDCDAHGYLAEAHELREALHRHMPDEHTGFGKNERDVVTAIWPCEWAESDEEYLLQAFENWWQNVRCPQGEYSPERLWTYFPVGEAHNYMILGQRERTWKTLNYFLDNQSAPGLYGWPEGERDENSALLMWQQTRGWDRIPFVTPTSWTLSEMFLLMRDALVREDGDSLIIGQGIPTEWLEQPISLSDWPTHFGRVSLSYDAQTRTAKVEVENIPAGGVRNAFPQPVELEVNL